MSHPIALDAIIGQVVGRCIYNKYTHLDQTKIQLLMYYVRNQFFSELKEPGFTEPIYATESGPRIECIRDRLHRYKGDIHYEDLKLLYPKQKGFDLKTAALIYRAVDPAGTLSNEILLELANRQRPYQKALLSRSHLIRPEETLKFFSR